MSEQQTVAEQLADMNSVATGGEVTPAATEPAVNAPATEPAAVTATEVNAEAAAVAPETPPKGHQHRYQMLSSALESIQPGLTKQLNDTFESSIVDPSQPYAPNPAAFAKPLETTVAQEDEQQFGGEEKLVADMTQAEFAKYQMDLNRQFRDENVRVDGAVKATSDFGQVNTALAGWAANNGITQQEYSNLVGQTLADGGMTLTSLKTVPGQASRFAKLFMNNFELTERRSKDNRQIEASGAAPADPASSDANPLANTLQPAAGAAGTVELSETGKELQEMAGQQTGGVLRQMRMPTN